jgi:hypothetical protein
MAYRFLWKQIASKALGSAIAKALLTVNRDEMWDRLARTDSLPSEHVLRVRQEVEATLHQVELKGRKEREMVSQVLAEVLKGFLKGGKES